VALRAGTRGGVGLLAGAVEAGQQNGNAAGRDDHAQRADDDADHRTEEYDQQDLRIDDDRPWRVGLYGIDVSIGVLYFFAFGSLAFYGLMLGGWASGSKYSFLGAMRAAAQLISYEVALGLSLLGVAMTAGSLSLVEIVEHQDTIWFVVPQFVGFVIFLAFTTYDQSRAGAEAEALLVVQQFETAQFLAPETRASGSAFVPVLSPSFSDCTPILSRSVR
jgi:hypothetical protein